MINKIKPCPFCGEKAKLYEDMTGCKVVQCNKCGCGTLRKHDKNIVVSAWNNRVVDKEREND